MQLVVGMASHISFKNILQYFNISENRLTSVEREILKNITDSMEKRSIDAETTVAILQSYETKIKRGDYIFDRLRSFNKFIESIPEKSDLIETVKDYGLLSKDELENIATETGNWLPFMKRVDSDSKKAHEEFMKDSPSADEDKDKDKK